jgi:hypothetical protein
MGARRVLSLILCLGLAGCSGSAPSANPTSQAAIATASAALTPTPTPIETPVTPTPKATLKPPPTWTTRERAIRDAIRGDVRVGCAPRRHDLPRGTIAAVECQPGKDSVSRVGFYLFASASGALDVYLGRVRAEGLALDSDTGPGWEGATQCDGNIEPAAYPDGDTIHCRDREALFVNSDGYSNYRVVIGRLYIGALGTNRDIYALNEWAWRGSGQKSTDQLHGDTGGVPSFQTLWCDGARPKAKGALCAP